MNNEVNVKTREEMKEIYWKYFLRNPKYWGNGFTKKRLEKIKPVVFADVQFWWDILDRHMGKDYAPSLLKKLNESIYDHCMGNFMGMLMQLFVEHKIIKP